MSTTAAKEDPARTALAEREAFEGFCIKRWAGDRDGLRRRDMPGSERLGEYVLGPVEFAWQAWQARAAKQAPGFVAWWRDHWQEATPQSAALSEAERCALMAWTAALSTAQQAVAGDVAAGVAS